MEKLKIMRWGKYKGQHMDDVPASYLMWLYNDGVKGPVRDYIEKNLAGIKKQIEEGNGEI